MQVSKDVQQEVIVLLSQGYSIKSICVAMYKKHKSLELKYSDVVILAKKNNIKVGNKDITKEKVDLKTVGKMMPQIVQDKDIMKQVKSKLILIVLCLFALLGVIYFLTDWKITLGVFVGILIVLGVAGVILYMKIIKPNKQISLLLRNKK